LRAHRVRDLDVLTADGRREHITAASGLALAGDWLYVIADDRREIAVFPAEGHGPGRLERFLPGDLPADPRERKRVKPDVEAVAVLPGALLALESGSTPSRRGGALWYLGGDGALMGAPRRLDLAPLYSALEAELPDLNVEGAAAGAGRLLLFQRGNGAAGVNAVVELDLGGALAELEGGGLSAGCVRSVRRHDLGDVDGVRLGFTDASSRPDGGVVFTAVAEAGEDTYLDGACVGAAVGVLGEGGEVVALEALEPLLKIEGVEAARDRVLLVADPDDPGSCAPLYSFPAHELPATL
jgi:hypothetical protein